MGSKTMEGPSFSLGGRIVGPGHPPLVIAEIGINHEGSIQTALEMVEAAKAAGAECVKHQTHVVEDEMAGAAKSVVPGNSKDSIYDIMARCALSEEHELRMKKHTESLGMIWISTPFSRAAFMRLKKFGVPGFKIGSGECNNYPLVELIAQQRKPVILSTGMNSLASVAVAVAILRKHGAPFALLHTTNVYPTPPRLVRLGAMVQLRENFPDAVVGLSDHTTANYACFGAVALGACVLERHFTDHMKRHGPDIVNSMDTEACRELIQGANEIWECSGGTKGAVEEEQATIDFAFATCVTIAPVKQGEVFTAENLWVKRPGTGEILAEDYNKVLGKVAAVNLPTDRLVKIADVVGLTDVKRKPETMTIPDKATKKARFVA